MNYEAKGIIISVDWTRNDLQKGKIRKIDGAGPVVVTFFRPLCNDKQSVIEGKVYKYNLQDIDPELEILNDLNDPILGCLNEDQGGLFGAVLYSRTNTEKKKVAVDLEED